MSDNEINILIEKTALTFSLVNQNSLFERNRTREVCEARQAIWLTLYHKHRLTLYAIRDLFNYKTHSAILLGIQHAQRLCVIDKCYESKIKTISE